MTNFHLSPRLPYLDGLTPDPEGVASARTYAPLDRPAPLQRLEEFVMSLAYFHKLYTQQKGATLTPALREALRVFSFAASGFFALIEDIYSPEDMANPAAEWKALGFGLMWARSERNKAGAPFTPEEKEAFRVALLNPDRLPLLPMWASRTADRPEEAGQYAAWAALVYLLEHAPVLDDGETEDTLAQLLEAFAQPEHLTMN